MNAPPSPSLSAELLATASHMGFKPTVGSRAGAPELGVLVDPRTGAESPLLSVADSGGSGSAWAVPLGHDAEQDACIPHLMTRETYLVLHEGVLAGPSPQWSMGVTWQGRLYRIKARWDGHRPVAQAVIW